MKAALLVAVLLTSSVAQSAVLCQSTKDYNFKAWFEGYSCPQGFYLIRMK